MNRLRVSIVMACYNAEKTVAKAIESMLVQTEPAFEFIIVDDASHDQTAIILHQYRQLDTRIRVLTNPVNQGLAYSLNRAIRAASAPFIARMDADDSSLPDRLARQVAHLTTHPDIDVLGTATELISENGRWIGSVVLPVDHERIVSQRYLRPLFIHPSVMFRRTFFDRCGYYDERLRRTEDLDLWLRARTIARYGNLPDRLMRYTYRPKPLFRTFRSDMAVRFRHMCTSGELARKGHELIWYSIRFVLLTYTGYTSKAVRMTTLPGHTS
ncbi:glycosyltransferase [Spirosoma agri]|uniref:Glycosyltransferase n=1 Tax=Spirosoma agri TaxID=1987381 RepID=A0A6M0IPX0_9BACT|nr:glycosyltransferase [Spirosoma agri]NEU69595.1 glycosyltransferase [Spirosoma agri]